MSKKSFLIAILILVSISAFIMACHGPFTTHVPLDTYANDDVRYLHSAKTLIETGRLTYFSPGVSTVFIMPGYVFILAPFVALFGEVGAILAFKIFQVLLAILNIYLIGLIAKRVFGGRAANLAMIFAALYPTTAFASMTIYTETVFTTILLGLILLTIIAFEKNSLKYFAIAGVVWTIGVLFRPVIATFPLIMLIMFLIKKYSFKQIFRISLVVTAIFVVMMLPWWIRNYKTFNRFIPLTLSSGPPLYEGTLKLTTAPEVKTHEEMIEILKETAADAAQDEIAFDANMRAGAMERISTMAKENFPALLGMYATKMGVQWAQPFSISGREDALNFIVFITSLLLHLFFVLSFVLKSKLIKPEGRLYLLMIILYFNFMHVPFVALPRYMFPVMPLVMMFAADAWANHKFRGGKVA